MFPITVEWFNDNATFLLASLKDRRGRKPAVSDYHVFCAILYVLRTGIPWRDLPEDFGYWHTVYLRFKRGSDSGLWWRVLTKLQHERRVLLPVVIVDSTTIQVHRHGSGGAMPLAEMSQV
jgi:transposase